MITAPTMETETDFKPKATAETKPKRRRKNAADGALKPRKSKSPFPPDDYPKSFPGDRGEKICFYDVVGKRWLGKTYLDYLHNIGAFDRTALPSDAKLIEASRGDYFVSLDLDRAFRKRHRVPQYRITEELGRLVSLSPGAPDPIFPTGAV